MSLLAKLLVSILAFIIGMFLFALGGAFSPVLKAVVATVLMGSLVAIWRSEPPKADGHQLKKD